MYPGSINYKKIKNADSIKMNFPYIWSIYLNKIVSFWKETISHQANPPDRLYGLVPNEAYLSPDKVGEADVYWNGGSGRVAVGADIETMFAHELLHLLDQEGLHHAKWEYNNSKCEHKDESNYNKLMKDADYLNDTGNLDIVGFRLTAPGQEKLILKKTDNTYDVMTYCNPRWISEYNYKKLRLGFEDFSPSIDQLTNSSLSNQGDLMLISGIVYSDTMDVEFAPLFPLGPYAQADLDLVGDYCLEQRAADNTLLDSNCFDLTFYNYETGEIRNEDGFVRALQSYTDTKSIELTYLGGTIGEITASEHTPNVDLLSPNGGEIWGVDGSQSVQWQASDDDSDELHFALFFSPDDGISWSPVALELLGTQTDIDISVFEGSPAARLKVIASDGFHTSEDVSDNSFMVLQKSPEVIISNPTDETFLQHGYSAIFQGWASDIEDEAILNENLIWTSSLDGSLGSGEWIIAQNLSPGEHEITLFATDGDDNMSSSSITVFVGHRVFLPINTR